ncbi:MAG: DNA primase family protein [Tranquillimonas sp.]
MSDDGVHRIRAALDAAEEVDLPEDMAAEDWAADDAGSGDDSAPADDPPADPGAPEDALPPELAEKLPIGRNFPLNDYGNGRRLLLYCGDDMLFVPRLGWYRWDGKRWRADEDEIEVRRDAQKIAGLIEAELAHLIRPEEQATIEAGRAARPRLAELRSAQMRAGKGEDLPAEDLAELARLTDIVDRAGRVEGLVARRRQSHRNHAKASGNTSKISNMLQEARTGKVTPVAELNRDKLSLNCENGVLHFHVDLHDVEWGAKRPGWLVDLDPHHRRQRITKLVPVPYDPDAECPAFLDFLETVQPDPDIRGFLQRWFGYCLTGLTTEQKLAFFYGGGRNGKSTLVDAVAGIMADYGTTIPIETLTGAEQRKGSDATPDLVRLPGARFVRASEPEQGQRMKEALIKALTGGEAIMIRRMQQEFVEVVPEFKLTISGNHRPEIRGADDGIWRRVLLVPFTVQIPKEDVDPTLPETLKRERPGILRWMVEGCLDYLQGGLREPDAVLEATEEYRHDSDPLRVFLLEECTIGGAAAAHFEKARDLADAFNAWLLSRGESVWGRRTVATQLKLRANTVKTAEGHVFSPHKISDTGYLGIELSEEARDRIARFGDELRAGAGRKG